MPTEIDEWEIVAVQRHYEYLGLSNEQASRVAQFETETRNFTSGVWQFSYWEKVEYEGDFFRGLLSSEQWMLFEQQWQENIGWYETLLRNSDATEGLKDVDMYEEMVGWYKDFHVPAFRKEASQAAILFFQEKEKIDYLRALYTLFLRKARQEALVNHYRHCRTYQPNGLRLALLRQELLRMWPDYERFYREADGPTQTVADHVLTRYKGYCHSCADLFRQKSEEVKQRWKEARIKYTGEAEIPGWHVAGEERRSAEELGVMALVLMV